MMAKKSRIEAPGFFLRHLGSYVTSQHEELSIVEFPKTFKLKGGGRGSGHGAGRGVKPALNSC